MLPAPGGLPSVEPTRFPYCEFMLGLPGLDGLRPDGEAGY